MNDTTLTPPPPRRSRRALAATLALAPALLPLAGCPRTAPAGDVPGAASGSSMLTIKGSDTMVHLVTAWAEAYMKAHPEAQVSVTGGGSGTGIAALLNGTTDVCMASRTMKAQELDLAKQQGLVPAEHDVARDGIAVVVHPDNPVKELTLDQLRQLYNGTLTRWSEVGGPDQPVQLLSRESSSGTYVFFNEHVLKKDDFAANARLMPSTAAIVQAVEQDAWSIGYVGLGYLEGDAVRPIALKPSADAPGVLPSVETVQRGDYALARPLHLYTPGAPGALARDFIAFALSQEGQRIVQESGYVPVTPRATK